MSDSTANNKRIAKNTLLLYGRMLLIMAVTLYTSRVVLNALGVEDYGIYNVVGGIVTMFTFLYGALVTSTQRYLNFELGRGNEEQLKRVFTASNYMLGIIAIILVIISETVGLWFFYNKMVIPDSRMTAAMWVYQLSIVTMVIQIMSAPYNSVIIAHEKMDVFAVISIIEVILKLAVVYVLLFWAGDKLILYAVLIVLVQLLIRFIYTVYCKRHYEEAKMVKGVDKALMIEMGKFAGWNMWGGLASTLFGTGLNLLLNVFFGPIVNAARAVAVQVETAIAQLSNNFLTAVNPQITKLYAQDKLREMHQLVFRSSKFSCYLLLIISLPIMLETDMILTLWLKTVPDYTAEFIQVLLSITIIDAMARPLMVAAMATGDVKKYQTIIGGILILIVPIAYIVLKMGGNPTSVYIVHLSVAIVAFVVRLFIIRPLIDLSIIKYISVVIAPCIIVSVISFILSILVRELLPTTLLFQIFVCVLSIIIVAITSYSLGLTKGERVFINEKIVGILKQITHRDQNLR